VIVVCAAIALAATAVVAAVSGEEAASPRYGSLPSGPLVEPAGGRLVAVAAERGDRRVIGVVDPRAPGRVRALTRPPADPNGDTGDGVPTWSPDGRSIAYVAGRARGGGLEPRVESTVRVVGVRDRRSRVVHRLRDGSLSGMAWSPDGRHLALALSDGIHALRLDDGTLRRLTDDRRDAAPAFSPDGRALAFVRGPELRVLDLAAGTARVVAIRAGDPAWSPDGGRLAVVATEPGGAEVCAGESGCLPRTDVVAVDARTGRRAPLATSDRDEQSPSWSPDGTRLAVVASLRLLVVPAGGQAAPRALADGVEQAAWQP
jgi:TolB protein